MLARTISTTIVVLVAIATVSACSSGSSELTALSVVNKLTAEGISCDDPRQSSDEAREQTIVSDVTVTEPASTTVYCPSDSGAVFVRLWDSAATAADGVKAECFKGTVTDVPTDTELALGDTWLSNIEPGGLVSPADVARALDGRVETVEQLCQAYQSEIDEAITNVQASAEAKVAEEKATDEEERNAKATASAAANADLAAGCDPKAVSPVSGEPDLLRQMATCDNPQTRLEVAGQEGTPVDVLTILATDADPTVRRAVAGNRSTPLSAVSELIVDPEPSVRARAANQQVWRLTPDQIQALVDDSSTEVRRAVAGSNLSQQQALELAQDPEQGVVEALISELDFVDENPRALKAACARGFKYEFKAQAICEQVNR